MNFVYRKSKSKEDSLIIAEDFNKKFDIKPYALKELADVIKAGVRSGEIPLKSYGRSNILVAVNDWFQNRLIPNTVSVPVKMYEQALYCAFRLIILGNIAKTDFGSSRQRDFGQMLTDFTRGFLGESAIKIFLEKRFNLKVKLEEKAIGDIKQFLPTDISSIKDKAGFRPPKINFSIKTSKLHSLWLDIPVGQLSHSDIFCFIKIGLTVDHFVAFMKKEGFVKKLVDIAQRVGEVKKNLAKKELQDLLASIPNLAPWPAYIPGYVTKEDFKRGRLEVNNQRKKHLVVGGCGYFGDIKTNKVEGLGEISKGKYLASLGSLRWNKKDWKYIVKNL